MAAAASLRQIVLEPMYSKLESTVLSELLNTEKLFRTI